MKIKTIFLIFILGFYAKIEAARFSSSNQIGIQSTTNALLESAQPNFDVYSKFLSNNTLSFDGSKLTLGVGLSDYFSEHSQDRLSWNSRFTWLGAFHDAWDIYAEGFGLHHINGSPQTTESGFDNLGVQLGSEREIELESRTLIILNPSYTLKYFFQFQNRMDHIFKLGGELSHEYDSGLELVLDTGFSFLFSTLPDYHQFAIELGGTVLYHLTTDLFLSLDEFLLISLFMNRVLSTQTIIASKRNRSILVTSLEKESHLLSQSELELRYQLSHKISLGGGARLTLQSSKSGIENYKVLELFTKFYFKF